MFTKFGSIKKSISLFYTNKTQHNHSEIFESDKRTTSDFEYDDDDNKINVKTRTIFKQETTTISGENFFHANSIIQSITAQTNGAVNFLKKTVNGGKLRTINLIERRRNSKFSEKEKGIISSKFK